MQKRMLVLFFCFFSFTFCQNQLKAQYLCSTTTTSTLTNTTSAITLRNLAVYPISGPYTATLQYFDPNTNSTVGPVNVSTTVTSNGITSVVQFPLSSGFDLTTSSDVTLMLSGGGKTYTSGWNFGQCKTALPLTLTSFTAGASPYSGYNLLTWVTAQESMTSHFIIQRSTDAINWSSNGIEPAAGNSSSNITYNFYTPRANFGIKYYYRLQMIDIDGNFTYSSVKVVNGIGVGNPTNFCNFTNIEGPSSICGPSVYKVHNAAPTIGALSITSGTGCITTSNAGLVATVNGSAAGNITIGAAGGCNASKVISVCNGLTISGPGTICSSPITDTLIGAPVGAGISWSASPAGLVSISSSGNTATLTRTSTANATITLTASYTFSGCTGNQTVTATKSVSVGGPAVGINYSPNGACVGATQTWSLNANPTSNGSNWNWFVSYLGTGSSISIFNPSSPSTLADVRGGGTISLSYRDLCGATQTNGVTVYSSCHAFAVIAPNPASSMVTVSTGTPGQPQSNVASTSTVQWKIYQIKVINQGNNVLKTFTYPSGVSAANIDLSSLVNGTYTLQIFDNTNWSSQQVIILR